MPLLPPAITALVAQDGQPRAAQTDDGAQHMVWREDGLLRSCLLADWPAAQAALAAREAERDRATALRQAIRAQLQSTAGVRVDELLVGQLRALVAYLLWREGAIDADMRIRPIGEWEQ